MDVDEQSAPGRRPRLAMALAVLLAGAAVAFGVAVLLLSDTAVRIGENTPVNPPGIVDANNSPTATANPVDPDNVVVVHRRDRPEYGAALHWTDDGGETWETTELPLPAGKDRPFAPDAAFAPDGTLYVSYVNLTGAGNTPENLWLVRSDDGGRSVSEPVRVTGELAFQARVAVAPDGTVHVVWLQAEEVAVLSLPEPAPIVAVHSTDGGRTFSETTRVSDDGRDLVGAPSVVVDDDGGLFVLYVDFKDDARDFRNLEGPAWDQPVTLVLTRSQDAGQTFASGVEVDDGMVLADRFMVFLPEFPSLASDGEGSLYVAWSDNRSGDRDVLLRRSTDRGATWSEPTKVNDNPAGDGTDQYLPQVAVAPSGRVDVVFLDRRHDPGNTMTDAYQAMSSDGGSTFRNVRVSADSFDSRIGPRAADHLPPDLGSRLGLVSWEDAALPVWVDTRLGTLDSLRQDIVATRVQVPDLALVDRLPRLALSVLALLAIVLLGLWAWGRATSGAGAPSGGDDAGAPSGADDAGDTAPPVERPRPDPGRTAPRHTDDPARSTDPAG